jgi:hypothetical protein
MRRAADVLESSVRLCAHILWSYAFYQLKEISSFKNYFDLVVAFRVSHLAPSTFAPIAIHFTL